MQIYNPTDEAMTAMYAGRPYTFPPESVTPVDDKASANHIINEFSVRGLVALEYGDDTREGKTGKTIKEEKGVAGVEANHKFRREQVIRVNQDNEARKQASRPYVAPSNKIKEYAEREGISLLKPYEVDDIQAQEMNRIKEESRSMKETVAEQNRMINELLATMKSKGVRPPEQKEPVTEKIELVRAFTKKSKFKAWYDNNITDIRTWPEEAKTEVRKAYTGFFGGEAKI